MKSRVIVTFKTEQWETDERIYFLNCKVVFVTLNKAEFLWQTLTSKTVSTERSTLSWFQYTKVLWDRVTRVVSLSDPPFLRHTYGLWLSFTVTYTLLSPWHKKYIGIETSQTVLVWIVGMEVGLNNVWPAMRKIMIAVVASGIGLPHAPERWHVL